MIPVEQTITGGKNVDPSKRGNCYTAAIASVLELPIEQVPHFVAIDGDEWWDAVQDFFRPFGLRIEFLDVTEHPEFADVRPAGYWLASITSTRGDWNHVVVMHDDVVVWDPWPGDDKTTELGDRLRLIEWFQAIDPAVAVRGMQTVTA